MPGYVGPLDQANQTTDDCTAIIKQAGDLVRQDQTGKAIKLLERSVEQHPSWTPLHQGLVQLYVDTSQFPEARREILRLHELGHKDPQFSIMLAATLLGKRQFAEAIIHLREAKALGAPAGEWLLLLAEVLQRTGRLEEAETIYLEQLEACDKERSRLLVGLAAIKLQRKQFREAADYALQVIKARPAKSRALYFLGIALMRMGQAEGSIRAFERFAERQPHRVAPYRWLERYARQAGDDDQADAYNLKARNMLDDRRRLRLEKRRLDSR